MDDEHLDEGTMPLARPSETIQIRESYAKDVIAKGLHSLTRLEAFVRHLSSTLLDFSSNLKAICLEEELRSGAVVLDQAPGASELWTVLQSLTMMISESQEKTANALVVDFSKPLEEMHGRLDKLKKSFDLLKRQRKFDIALMENYVEKEKRTCLKAMKSLQNSVKSLIDSTNSTGIFSKMTRRRYERAVKKKIFEVQKLFQRYQNIIVAYNKQFEDYETTIQTPLLLNVHSLETKRLELLKQCTMNLEIYISTITSPEQASSILMKNLRDSINEVKEMSTTASLLPQQKLQFVYDLPCTPDAFDYHTWPGSSGLVWCKGSVSEASTRKDSIDRRLTMPDIQSNRNIWAISQNGDSDQELHDDLKTIEEDNVEPRPMAPSFSLVKPKVIGSWNEGDSAIRPPRIGYVNGPGFNISKKEPESLVKRPISFNNFTKPFPTEFEKPTLGRNIVSKSKADEISTELSHLTLSRPAMQRPRQPRPTSK